VRRKALAAGAGAWLDGLDGLVADLEQEWGLTVGRQFTDGTEAFAAEATLDDGSPAVLKLLIPRPYDTADNAVHEIEVLRRAGGEGCARLLRSDATRNALLVERLGRSLSELGLPLDRRHEILVEAASKIWRPAAGSGLPTGAEKARWLAERVARQWETLGRPCSERAVAHAVACAERRAAAHDDERAVLVHGDVHQWNALESLDGSGTFKLIDPDGMLAEAEYDLGIVMREDPIELLDGDGHPGGPGGRARRLAHRTGLDPVAVWEWGVVERVSTGLECCRIDLQPVGHEMLAVADHLATHTPTDAV
jgi:streptomycin 6-kinase